MDRRLVEKRLENFRKKPVENRDLWERLLQLTRQHCVAFHKVKGHADNAHNNRCDELARKAIQAGQDH